MIQGSGGGGSRVGEQEIEGLVDEEGLLVERSVDKVLHVGVEAMGVDGAKDGVVAVDRVSARRLLGSGTCRWWQRV